MAPETSRDFLRAAAQRLGAAEALLSAAFTLDAQYLGGYTIECSLKALILDRTPEAGRDKTLKRITTGATMHLPETLLGELRNLDEELRLPLEILKRLRRSNWSTRMRYETGRRATGETKGFLKTVKAIYHWVEAGLS